MLNGLISTSLTDDFWAIRLPDDLVSSSTSASPAYQTYLAALNILDANLFMLHGKIRDWTDPTATSVKNVEGHHLFPRAYLQHTLGYTDIKKINQVANFAPTDWATNNLISDKPPAEYWPELVADRGFSAHLLAQQMRWHAIPENWTELGYEDFLIARRHLISAVVHDGYQRLTDPTYQPEIAVSQPTVDDIAVAYTLQDLFLAGLLTSGDLVAPVDTDSAVIAEITDDGDIRLNDKTYDSPLQAARAAGDENMDGWDFWAIPTDSGPVTLRELGASLHQ